MFKAIASLFRFVYRVFTWLRSAFFNLIFLFILVLVVQGIKSAPEIELPDQSVLFLTPSGSLVDQSTFNPDFIDLLAGPADRPAETVLHDLIQAITYARDDDEITGIALKLDYMTGAGISKIEELGQAMNYFKESGKPIIAFADSMNQQQYLLASYADEVFIHPMGSVYLTGFGVYRNYFKSAADKLAIKFHVFRTGEFKDAVEPFMRDNMSEESKQHNRMWLTSLWQRYTSIIEYHRKLEPGTLDQLIADLDDALVSQNGNAAELALEQTLVDAALSRLGLKATLLQRFDQSGNEELETIGLYGYLKNPLLTANRESENKIGLIVATGNIVEGQQPESAIGSATLSALIKKAREDDSLSALVIRVDSGGGSAFASEVIRDQLQLTNASGLPVYISMGSVAASGGYWISAPGTEIWATPATITGSIGVFGLIPNVSDSVNKLGIYSDGIATSDLADIYNIDRELSPRAKRIIQSGVDHIYDQFLTLVAEARNSTVDEIHEIAQGRVWSGEKALELGLVDQLGSLKDTLEYAASQQGLADFSIKAITRDLNPREQFVRTLMDQSSVSNTDNLPMRRSSYSWLNMLESIFGKSESALLLNALSQPQDAPAVNTYASCLECIAL